MIDLKHKHVLNIIFNHKSTSEHKDVIEFINNLKRSYEYIRIENIATSSEGRDIPLLIIGNPLPESPESMKDDDRIVVYIQGNIHAGEVEGKEASLMFARDILKTGDSELLKKAVILICPILNPDGNDKISANNRTSQNGPVSGVGVRYNGQFLDLNRDALKAESPEVKGRYLAPQWGMGFYPYPVYKLVNNTGMNSVPYCN